MARRNPKRFVITVTVGYILKRPAMKQPRIFQNTWANTLLPVTPDPAVTIPAAHPAGMYQIP